MAEKLQAHGNETVAMAAIERKTSLGEPVGAHDLLIGATTLALGFSRRNSRRDKLSQAFRPQRPPLVPGRTHLFSDLNRAPGALATLVATDSAC